MPIFTALTLTESFSLIEATLREGSNFIEASTGFTRAQLAHFIDQFYLKVNLTSTIERSLSKSLCCFLFELNNEGPSHYSDIRTIVKDRYSHQVNDYSSLRYWRLIKPSNRGVGFWEITDRGQAFLEGRLRLSEKVTIKNKRVIAASPDLVSITDFEGFDYVSYNPITLLYEPSTEI